MYPYCHPLGRLSRTLRNGTVPRSPGGCKGHPASTRFFTEGRGFPTPPTPRFSPMLCLHVSRQRLEQHLLPALRALNPTPLPLLLRRPHSRYPSPVRRLQLRPCRLAWASDHVECLTDGSIQANPVKQAYQGAETPLEPSRVQQCDHAIIHS